LVNCSMSFPRGSCRPFVTALAHFGPDPFNKTMQPKMHAKLCYCPCFYLYLYLYPCPCPCPYSYPCLLPSHCPNRRQLLELLLHLFTFAWTGKQMDRRTERQTDGQKAESACLGCIPISIHTTSAFFKPFYFGLSSAVPRSQTMQPGSLVPKGPNRCVCGLCVCLP